MWQIQPVEIMTLHLKENGVTDNQILEMNFESHAYKNMNSDSFYEYVKQHIVPNKRMYLFFDEVQRVPDWEDAVNSFLRRLQLRYLCHRLKCLYALL